MKRLAVLALLAGALLMVAVTPAGATVHPLMSGECSAPPATGTAGETGDPPGITEGDGKGPDSNNARPALATLDAGALEVVEFPTDWTGPASNGDNGDQHCQFPEGGSHPDDDDDTGTDPPFPGNTP